MAKKSERDQIQGERLCEPVELVRIFFFFLSLLQHLTGLLIARITKISSSSACFLLQVSGNQLLNTVTLTLTFISSESLALDS